MAVASQSPTPRTHIIGAGLIGASIGIGLTAEGWVVSIEDADADAQALAWSIGAGGELSGEPELVVVATPPAATPVVVATSLERWPDAVVTDVASVKAPIESAAAATGHGARYVGSHPMAGREVSGGLAAQGDLFRARPWVMCPGSAGPAAIQRVRAVAEALLGDVVTMDATAHDAAVARVSHAPQVAASAVAAALGSLEADDVALAGEGGSRAHPWKAWRGQARMEGRDGHCPRRSRTAADAARRRG